METAEARPSAAPEALRLASAGAVAVLTLPMVAGFLGAVHPFFDTLAHFRVHLAVAVAISALPLAVSRWWPQGFVAWLLAAVALATALDPALLPGAPQRAAFEKPDVTASTHTLLSANLLYDNATPDAFVALVRDRHPDVLALSEVSDRWADRLRGLLNLYPYQIRCGRGAKKGGTAVLSRFPFASGRFGSCSEDGSLAVAPLEIDGKEVSVAAIHLRWPWPRDQARQIGVLAPTLAALPARSIVAGDLNATPWSQTAIRLAREGGLQPMESPGPSWLFKELPSILRWWAGLPIDHVHVKDGILLYGARRLEVAGSDHLALLVEFGLHAEHGTAEPVLTAALR